MRTFLIVLNPSAVNCRTYAVESALKMMKRNLLGKEARDGAQRLANILDVELCYTPKVIGKSRVYLAVKK